MQNTRIPAPVKRRNNPSGIGAAADRLNRTALKQVFNQLDDAEPAEIVRLIDGARVMLWQNGSSFARLGTDIAAAAEFRTPLELEPTSTLNVTTAKLILQRHRRALGLSGEVVLSELIAKLVSGQSISRDDLSSFRRIQVRTRLVLEGSMA